MNLSFPSVSSVAERDRLYLEVVETFGAAIARLVSGYEANPEKRRDVLQEIHIQLWISLAAFNGESSLKTWVYRVSHNVAINHVIRDKRYRERTQIDIDELSDQVQQTDALDTVDTGHALERLRGLIQTLKPIDRQLILLYLDDLDAATIAEITGLSPANVATKIHRIKHLLARKFNSRGTQDV